MVTGLWSSVSADIPTDIPNLLSIISPKNDNKLFMIIILVRFI